MRSFQPGRSTRHFAFVFVLQLLKFVWNVLLTYSERILPHVGVLQQRKKDEFWGWILKKPRLRENTEMLLTLVPSALLSRRNRSFLEGILQQMMRIVCVRLHLYTILIFASRRIAYNPSFLVTEQRSRLTAALTHCKHCCSEHEDTTVVPADTEMPKAHSRDSLNLFIYKIPRWQTSHSTANY